MRTNMPSFGKRTVLTRDYFRSFEKCFGKSDGTSKRTEGDWSLLKRVHYRLWRIAAACFSRKWIADNKGDSLDISAQDEGNCDTDNLPEPEVLAAEALNELTRSFGR